MRQMVTLGLIGLAIGVVLVLTVGCGGESITNPSDVAVSQSGGAVSQTAVPTPTPTPSPEPVGSAPYVELNKNPKDGSGTLFNPKPHPVVFVLEYFDATNYWNQKLLKKIEIEVKPKSSYALKAWRPEECGIKITIQLDIAANVGHVGHVLYEVKTDECKCQKESVIESKTTYGEWSECKEGGDGCFSSRDVIKTTTTTDPCTNETKTVVEKSVETKACECVCVPTWEESTKVTYTEWGACEKQKDGSCAKYREKTIEIWQTNSCTKETKLYKTSTEREFEKCECVCEVTWEKTDTVYSEWSEWSQGTCGERTRTVSYREKNSCTGEIRVVKEVQEKETKECPPACEASVPSAPYCGNSSPADECGHYGLAPLGDVTGGFMGPKWAGTVPVGTALVIVKAGSCQSTGNKMHSLYFPPFTPNQMFMSATGKEISHITFCGCAQ